MLCTFDYLLKSEKRFFLSCRGETELKGRGIVKTYWLEGFPGYEKTLPEGAPDHGLSHGLKLEDFMSKSEIDAQMAVVADALAIRDDDIEEQKDDAVSTQFRGSA